MKAGSNMTVLELNDHLNLQIVTSNTEALENNINGAYIGDLLSWVMANLNKDNIWITIQGHLNIIAVASLAEASCIILTEGSLPDQDTLKRADLEGIPILTSSMSSYELAKQLSNLGV